MNYVKAAEILEANYVEIEAEVKEIGLKEIVGIVWIPIFRYEIYVGHDGERIICARIIGE